MHFLDDESFVVMFGTEDVAIKSLMSLGAMRSTRACQKCGDDMVCILNPKKRVFRCNKELCGKPEVSCRKSSLFYGSMLPCKKVMRLARSWLQNDSRETASQSAKVNRESVTVWYSRFRELVAEVLAECKLMLGGPGVIVEVDETKLGKRKYHRGHRVEGVWVVCGVERTDEKRAFCVHVKSRDKGTLRRVVSENVAEGSIVYTDCWKGYNGIAEHCKVHHCTVNHSRYFKDPATGVCTNGVEGLNSALKAAVIRQHRTEKFAGTSVAAYIWKRQNKNRLCEAFFEALEVYLNSE